MRRIIVVDDKRENLEAAKQAAKEFPEIEFEFLTSASQGLRRLEDPLVDGIITDLFFPPEQDEELLREYGSYIQKVRRSPKFPDIVKECYYDQWEKANKKVEDLVQVMKEGNSRAPLEREIKRQEAEGFNPEPLRTHLANLPEERQFPYGGVLMLRAKALGKRHVLITDLHRHAGEFLDMEDAIDGWFLFLPLMEEEIMTLEEVDSDRGRAYIGDGELSNVYSAEYERIMRGKSEMTYEMFRKGRKEQPAAWVLAIKKVLAQ